MLTQATYRGALCFALAVAASLSPVPDAQAQSADEPPPGPRVIHVPTAWMQAGGRIYASAGANHRGGAFGSLTLGLGGLAEVSLVLSDRAIACDQCRSDAADTNVEHVFETSAVFRLGIGNGVLWPGPPALALGFRRSIASRDVAGVRAALAELYLVGSHSIGTLDMHAGARLHSARADREPNDPRELLAVGAFAGLQWRPSRYPRTMLMTDFSFAPEFRPADVDLRWLIGWGVRYQALSFGSIELGARHRQGEGFDDAAVLIRLNGTFR